jgi:hypothetical protein
VNGVALMYSGWDTYLAEVVDVEVGGDGEIRVRRVVCAVDCGAIRRRDFGASGNVVWDRYGIMIGERVDIDLAVEAVRQSVAGAVPAA